MRIRNSVPSSARSSRALTSIPFTPSPNYFESLSTQDAAVELSGQLKTIAVSPRQKIANDLRWMNSGPLAGLGEIALPALQPGSSIMPGKVNPVIPEAAAMVAAQVIGNDATITVAGQSRQLPAQRDAAGDRAQPARERSSAREHVARARQGCDRRLQGQRSAPSPRRSTCNPILVTALNSVIGYDKGAAIAKQPR